MTALRISTSRSAPLAYAKVGMFPLDCRSSGSEVLIVRLVIFVSNPANRTYISGLWSCSRRLRLASVSVQKVSASRTVLSRRDISCRRA